MSGKKEISIAFQTDKSADEYIALAQFVNQFDFDAVSVYCDAPYHPSYGPLMLMAPHLTHARIGPAAVSPFRVHPIDIAAQTALLADVAQSGVYVGLARGAWLAEHGIEEPSAPIQGIREAVQIVKNLLAGESGGIDGKVFQISEHVRAPYPVPLEEVPVMIGTWGKKLARVAGQVADEVKIGGSANLKMAAHLQASITAGEQQAGRKPGSVGIVVGCVTVVDEDRALARQKVRQEAALYLPVVASLDPTVDADPELMARIQALVNQGQVAEAGALIPDDLLDLFAFAGNPDDLIAQTLALFEAGVSRVEYGTPHGLAPQTGIDLLGRVVVPEVRKAI